MNAGPLIFLAAMVAVFWFLLIRPQRQRQAAHRNLIGAACSGRRGRDSGRHDRHGRSIEDHLAVEIAPGTEVRIAKEAVTGVRRKDEEFAASEIEGAANLVRHKWLLVAPICSYSGHAYRAPRHPRDRAPVVALPESPKLGLDLQGGLEIVLRAVPPKGTSSPKTTWTARSNHAVARRQARRRRAGDPSAGEDQISLQLPGISDPQNGRPRREDGAALALRPAEEHPRADCAEPGARRRHPAPMDNLFQLLSSIQPQTKQGTPEEYYLVDPKAKKVILGPEDTTQRLKSAGWGSSRTRGRSSRSASSRTAFPRTGSSSRHRRAVLPGRGGGPADSELPLPDEVRAGGPREPGPGDDRRRPQARRHAPGLPAGRGRRRPDGVHDSGGDKFHEITRELAARGRQISNQGVPKEQALQSFAIVLDREIKSAPTIDWDDNPDGIAGGSAEITGIGDVGEAKDAALVLQTGALPVEFEQIDLTEVSATLGKDSLREAITASLIGLAVVALFLLLVYRFLGLVAIVGLALNFAFLYAVILLFDVTLTLPGFAGMILAIGVAADANIVIFERIKEEAAERKSVRAAISAGYRKGSRRSSTRTSSPRSPP